MVNKSKNIEVNEITKPNIINGLDLKFSSSLRLFLEDNKLLFLLERRLEKGLITINLRSKLVTLKFQINFYGNQQYFDNLLQVWIPYECRI